MISIIIPNYNKAKFVEETIYSVINQTFKDWECIIIDDNSSDTSFDIISNLIIKDSRFKLIKIKKNKGACYCRNMGLKQSIGDYIFFLDADDLISIDCLKSRFKYFSNNKEHDFLVFPTGTFRKYIGDNTWVWNNFFGNHLKRFLIHDLPWVICSVIWKKNFLIKVGGFDESFLRLQDVDLHTRALNVENVKYLTFSNSNPDSFYRIDITRIPNYFIYIKNDINGKINFIKNFKSKNSNSNKYLKGTFFECFQNVFVFYRKNKLNESEFKDLKKFILTKKFILKFNTLDMIILNLFIAICNTKFYIRGLNSFFKLIFIR